MGNYSNTMKTAAKKDVVAGILPKDWQEQKGANFSEDDLIDAYFKGQDDGRTANEKIIIKAFHDNLLKATSTAEKFVYSANHLGLMIVGTLMKIEAVDKFKILFIISEEDYVSEKCFELLNFARETKENVEQDTFTLDFSFTYHSEALSDDCMAADGYTSRYAGKGKA